MGRQEFVGAREAESELLTGPGADQQASSALVDGTGPDFTTGPAEAFGTREQTFWRAARRQVRQLESTENSWKF